jgi:hypothetical protein
VAKEFAVIQVTLDQNEYGTIMELDFEQVVADEQLRSDIVKELVQGRELSNSDGTTGWSGEMTERVAAAIYEIIGRQWPPADEQPSGSLETPSDAQDLGTALSQKEQLPEDLDPGIGATESVWLAFSPKEGEQIQRALDERQPVSDEMHLRLRADGEELWTRVKRQWHTRNRYPTHHTPWQAKRANLDEDVVEVLEHLAGRKSPSRTHN